MEESELYSEMVELIDSDEFKKEKISQYSINIEAENFLSTLERYASVKSHLEEIGLSFNGRVLIIGTSGTDFRAFATKIAKDRQYKIATLRMNQILGNVDRQLEGIRLLFEMARRNAPCILSLEQVDVIAPSKSSSGALLMQELNSITWSENEIVTIATTTQPDNIDRDLLELFGSIIVVEGTTLDDRVRVFESVLRNREHMPVTTLAELTRGWSFIEVIHLAINILIKTSDDEQRQTREAIERLIEESRVIPISRAGLIASITERIRGQVVGRSKHIDVEYPEEFVEQLYLEAVADDYSSTQRVIDTLNSNMPLSEEDLRFLTRYPFILAGTSEERTMNLIKAKRTIDRLRRIMGRK